MTTAFATDVGTDTVSRRPRRAVPSAVWTAILVAGVLGLWELIARTAYAGSYVLAPPSAIVQRVVEERPLYLRNLGYTARNAAWGFWWGNVAAIGAATVATVVPSLRRIISGVALTSFCLPLVALAPILRVVLGPGDSTPITLAALAVFFTTFISARLGFDSASTSTLEVVRALGRGSLVAFWYVRLRSSVPAVFGGLQIAAPAAFLGALVGEFAGSSRGFGILTIQALRGLETDRVWAVAVVSTLVSCGAYMLVGFLGRVLCPWAPIIDLTAAPATRTGRGWPVRLLALVVPVVCVLGLWLMFLVLFDVDAYFAKTPLDVWRELVTGPEAAEMRSTVFPALWSTLGMSALGFIVGIAGGVLLAAVFNLAPPLERALLPVAVALRAVPIIATTPVIILALGRGIVATVAIVAIMSFFPTLVNCTAAMRRTPQGILDVVRSYDGGPLARTTVAHLPFAVPAILASARIAVPTALLGATVAEWLATGKGLGNLMTVAANTARYDQLWVCVALLTTVAVLGYWLVSVVETSVLARIAPERSR